MRTAKYLLLSMRPKQWIKNLFVFAGLIFSLNLFHSNNLQRTSAAFVLFSIVAGCVYIINDLVDMERDRCHPTKKERPLAAGKLSAATAVTFVTLVLPLCFIAAWMLNLKFTLLLAAYLVLQFFYSFMGKNIVILDVMLIALGFVIRAAAGAYVIHINISHWLLICTLLLALFLGFCKRRNELQVRSAPNGKTRKVLDHYDIYLIDQMIAVVTASTLMAYILYTISPDVVRKFHTKNLLFTVPMVLFGILRYLYLVHKRKSGESPEKMLLSDFPLLINIMLWFITVLIVLYFPNIV